MRYSRDKKTIARYEATKSKTKSSAAKASIQKKIDLVKERREKLIDRYVTQAAKALTAPQRGLYFGPKLYSAARRFLYGISLNGDQAKAALKVCADLAAKYECDPTKRETYVKLAANLIQSRVFNREQKKEYREKKKEAALRAAKARSRK